MATTTSGNTYFASALDVNLVRNVFVPSYKFDAGLGQFVVQLDTNLRGNVAIGDTSTNYTLRLNGVSLSNSSGGGTSLPAGSNWGDYLHWNGISSYIVGSENITLGCNAGQSNQGTNAVAIGAAAGNASQGSNSVAIGYNAGVTNQAVNAVAIGYGAGNVSQGDDSIAIGQGAGDYQQNLQSIAIGANAGNSYQGTQSVAIGAGAGTISQGDYSIAIGSFAGEDSQISNSIILNATDTALNAQTLSGFYVAPIRTASQAQILGYSTNSKEITYMRYPTQADILPPGSNWGSYLFWNGSLYVVGNQKITLGCNAGQTNQGSNAVAVGALAGNVSQGDYSVAVGWYAGQCNQRATAVAVGGSAGNASQGVFAVAIGFTAGQTTQGSNAVAIGAGAGVTMQGTQAVAIGFAAGNVSQGSNSVAIGYNAGLSNQIPNSIILNATGGVLDAQTLSGFYVAPIRNATTTSSLYYNPVTKEITYGVSPSGTVPAGTNFGDYLRWNSTTSSWAVGGSNVAIGSFAGSISQGIYSTAVNYRAGYCNQEPYAISIGYRSGEWNQNSNAIAIGNGAGNGNQQTGAIAIGEGAGTKTSVFPDPTSSQGERSIAIGSYAGAGQTTSQGSYAVALGPNAGRNNQAPNSIILNASSNSLDSTTSGFFVKPLRTVSAATAAAGGFCNVVYNPSSGEFAYTS